MNVLQFQNLCRAAYRAAHAAAPELPAWETLNAAQRRAWFERVETEYNANAIAGVPA